jgi:hypothetical protein
MTKVLEMNNFAKTADCIVEISRDVEMEVGDAPTSSPVNAAPQGSSGSASLPTQMFIGLMVLVSTYLLC